ncbi:hypothetical protein [Flavobacterium sp. W22_SRS_FP1]|uniref:hypothetical protein n=1 Tax=Flavobacterium sp. W22_SRS_FP1 TaxID=3240276 RepID=UPI003F9041D8
MKYILKIITVVVLTLFVTTSCQNDDTSWDALTKAPDKNATYYLQFKDANQSLVVEVDPGTGDIIDDVSTTIIVTILGTPLKQDLVVNLQPNTSSTATSNMYVLSASTVTIPAGSVSASITVSTVAEKMPVDEEVKLILDIVSENNATAGTTLEYTMLRPGACLPLPGTYKIDMIDTYGDGWQTTTGDGGAGMTLTIDGATITEFGMCTDYEASPYACTEGPSNASTTVVIPEGTTVAEWYFPGDAYGEISFKITAPDGSTYNWDSAVDGAHPAGIIDFKVCK